jgi:hypothetical protein
MEGMPIKRDSGNGFGDVMVHLVEGEVVRAMAAPE